MSYQCEQPNGSHDVDTVKRFIDLALTDTTYDSDDILGALRKDVCEVHADISSLQLIEHVWAVHQGIQYLDKKTGYPGGKLGDAEAAAFRIAELEKRVAELHQDVQAARKDRDEIDYRYDKFKLAVEQGKRISRRDRKTEGMDPSRNEVEELRRRIRELEGHNGDLQARLQRAYEEKQTFQGECMRDVRERVHSKMFAGETVERADVGERKGWFGR